MISRQQGFNQVRPDETSSARNKHSHLVMSAKLKLNRLQGKVEVAPGAPNYTHP
jgi:hypothetical protein